MFAKDIMSKCSTLCTGEMPLMEAYQMMLNNGIDFLPVIEDYAHRMPIGVITEHDICLQIVGQGRNPRNLTAASVMNTNIVKTPETSSLAHCSQMLGGSKSKKLFIMDENGALCGIVTQQDVNTQQHETVNSNLNRSAFLGEYRTAGINRIF